MPLLITFCLQSLSLLLVACLTLPKYNFVTIQTQHLFSPPAKSGTNVLIYMAVKCPFQLLSRMSSVKDCKSLLGFLTSWHRVQNQDVTLRSTLTFSGVKDKLITPFEADIFLFYPFTPQFPGICLSVLLLHLKKTYQCIQLLSTLLGTPVYSCNDPISQCSVVHASDF